MAKDSEFTQRLNDFVADCAGKIAEDAVTAAREAGIYHNQTGNLRSSIGAAVVRDGRIINQPGFEQYTGADGDGAKGLQAGEQYLKDVAADISEPPGTTTIVVTAGMDYAGYVEDCGLDVLRTAEVVTERAIDDFANVLGDFLTDEIADQL